MKALELLETYEKAAETVKEYLIQHFFELLVLITQRKQLRLLAKGTFYLEQLIPFIL